MLLLSHIFISLLFLLISALQILTVLAISEGVEEITEKDTTSVPPLILVEDLEGLEEQVLILHNEYRAKHGSPPLRLNPKLSEYCKGWARNLANNENITIKHSFDLFPERRFGENIYVGWGDGFPLALLPKLGTDYWYNEIRFYDWDNPVFSFPTSHFTQLLWKETKDMGVAATRNQFGHLYLVTQYTPKGNIYEYFVENVPRLIEDLKDNDGNLTATTELPIVDYEEYTEGIYDASPDSEANDVGSIEE